MAAPRVIDPDTLRKELMEESPRPVYLLAGPDGFRAERTARWLRGKVVDESAADFNTQTFYADESSPAAIAEAASAYPMFGGARFVWVRHAEQLPSGKPLDPLMSYLERPADSTVLVLSASKMDRRLRLTAACAEAGRAVDFQLLSGASLFQQIRRQTKEHGVELAPAAMEALVELVGEDLGELDTEIQKLALLGEEGVSLGEDDVRSLVAQSRDLNAFTLADLLDGRRPEAALQAWMELRARGGDIIGTAAIVSWRFRQLLQLRSCLDEGMPLDAAARRLGLAPWQAKRLGPLANASESRALEATLESLRQADRRAKSSRLGDGLAYDLALLAWAVEGSA